MHSSIYPEFLAAVVEATKALVVGDGFAENGALGPIQNSLQYHKLQGLLEDIENQKLSVAVGGKRSVQGTDIGKGDFLRPTIVDNPPDDSRIVRKESFGKFRTFLRA